MKKFTCKTAGFAAVLAAGAVMVQAPYAAALTVHHAPPTCVKAEKDGRYVTKCTYRDTSTITKSWRGGRVAVHNHTKTSAGVSVGLPPAPPPVLPPQSPEPPPVVPPPALAEYTVQVFHAGVYQIPENSLFTKVGMAEPGLTTPDEIQSALGVSDAFILQELGKSGITFQKTVSGNTVTLVIPNLMSPGLVPSA